jgi:hypothetical protein
LEHRLILPFLEKDEALVLVTRGTAFGVFRLDEKGGLQRFDQDDQSRKRGKAINQRMLRIALLHLFAGLMKFEPMGATERSELRGQLFSREIDAHVVRRLNQSLDQATGGLIVPMEVGTEKRSRVGRDVLFFGMVEGSPFFMTSSCCSRTS